MTGPAMATTRPDCRVSALVGSGAVVVMSVRLPWCSGGKSEWAEWAWSNSGLDDQTALVLVGVGPQGLGAADDLHDLGGDGVLASPVHDPRVLLDQFLGVVGGGGHRPLPSGELRCRGFEKGDEDGGLGRPRCQRLEELGGVGLEFGVSRSIVAVIAVGRPRGAGAVTGDRIGSLAGVDQGQKLLHIHALGPGGEE